MKNKKKKRWVQHKEMKGLFMFNYEHTKPEDGTPMKFICDWCDKEKIWIYPKMPKKWKVYENNKIICGKYRCWKEVLLPHTH